MRLAELDSAALRRSNCLLFKAGPFQVRLKTNIQPLLETLQRLYPYTELLSGERIADFHIRIKRPANLRRWWRPQAIFQIDGLAPFEPFPLDHVFPFFEWGLNFCIANRAHQYCMLHSAVVCRDDRAMILPAMPGSGKSTLCAGLIHRGWRLLSDEFGLVRPESGKVVPIPRVIPLKNQSIDVIRNFAPEAIIGPLFPNTRKGTVAHLAPPEESILAQDDHPEPQWLVFPRYQPNCETHLEPIYKSLGFTRLAHNSFNYHLLGETGYKTLTTLIRKCRCFSLYYSDLDSAVDILNQMTETDVSLQSAKS